MKFKLKSDYAPAGDQPQAIGELVDGINRGVHSQVLLGVTGSGKTFTMANVIERTQLPTLIISHNKTLAAQLFQEFKEFFPENAVEYFVSFYDYYQPEAYIPSTDTYISKTSMINDEIDRLRLKATSSLLSRRDVVIVASVSCIYGIGSPEAYEGAAVKLREGQELNRREFLLALADMQYRRNDMSLERGTFRVKGDVVEIQPAYEENAVRIETFGDQLETISYITPLTGKIRQRLDEVTIFPAKHYMTTGDVTMAEAVKRITEELDERLSVLRGSGKLVEAQRLEQRTRYDMEMLAEVGYVNGIENYSRILDGRGPGTRPYTLIDFFKPPYLLIVDESHATLPQIQGMYNGDRARKETLVDHGFRLPCALDNRPLKFHEFEGLADKTLFVSATPGDYELSKSGGLIVEQVIRPTHLVDPPIEIRPAANQVDDLIEQLRVVVERGERTLVTTLTKKMAEDLTEYLGSIDFRVRYLHSEIDTLERTDILKDLRTGEFDILIGINLLREGLDLPEVALVAILDADKEGFLRSARSIVQIAGRAARNVNGRIILYADSVTDSISKAMEESGRRRSKQLAYNKERGITPRSAERRIDTMLSPYGPSPTAEFAEAAEPSTGYGKKRRGRKTAREDDDNIRKSARGKRLEKGVDDGVNEPLSPDNDISDKNVRKSARGKRLGEGVDNGIDSSLSLEEGINKSLRLYDDIAAGNIRKSARGKRLEKGVDNGVNEPLSPDNDISDKNVRKPLRGKQLEGSINTGVNKPYRNSKKSSTNGENGRLMMIEAEMIEAAKNLDFERAAALRDRLASLKQGNGE
ncbi:MAG: excinuclease ABC subunit UvrB [Chitinispirillales bacterium]|jgi:excinuclease ABC subunit B|nr:excinuclease ABC subunit UvrB [Chitinispirillales bacterium]